jgi:uncharacterized protein YdaU (DUF1376 family)
MKNTRDKDPLIHFPFYINQYQGILSRYSLEEKGAFISLLCVYLIEDSQLPENQDQLFRMCLAFSEGEKKAVLLVKDKVIETGQEILKYQKEKREKCRESARIGGLARIAKAQAIAEETLKRLSSNTDKEIDKETETETEIDIDKELQQLKRKKEEEKILLESQFESFWNLYDKKKSRPDAEKKFKAALTKDTFDNIIAGLEKYIKARSPDAQFWKHPSTWLHNECWKDDYNQTKNTDSGFNSTQWSKY